MLARPLNCPHNHDEKAAIANAARYRNRVQTGFQTSSAVGASPGKSDLGDLSEMPGRIRIAGISAGKR